MNTTDKSKQRVSAFNINVNVSLERDYSISSKSSPRWLKDGACLPLVQRVRDAIPGRIVNFLLKIFNLGARRGGDVHFLIARLHVTGLDKITNPSAVYMLRRHIVLLIVIRPSDGHVKPSGPLGVFREEQAMSRHRVPPSPFLSFNLHPTTTQLHYTTSYTYSHPNLNFL